MPGTDVRHLLYDAAMPKGPLIQDRRKREIAVAISMGLLLVVSLVLCLLITGASLGR